MKDWWLNLSLRERQTLLIGGFFLVLLLLYEIIWAPLSDKVTDLRTKVRQDSSLLAWMKQADLQIQELATTQTSALNATSSLLSTVQTQINKSTLAKHLGQLRQSESDTVQLTLTNVNFDQLISWLTEIGQHAGVIVAQISVKPSGGPGVVSADITLKHA